MDVKRCSGTVISIPQGKHKISALFYNIVNEKEHLENKPIILRLHGTLGNFMDESEHYLPEILAQRGYSSLTMNTLLANLGMFFGFGLYDKVVPQIDAVCDFLLEAGFKKIVIAGHGLGGCMAVQYASLRNDPEKYPHIVGAVAISTPYSMPDAVRRKWEKFSGKPTYDEVYDKAKKVCKPAPGEEAALDEIVVIKKAHGSSTLPKDSEVYTLKTWWSMAGPEAEGTKTYKHIGNIKVPILIACGLKDENIEPGEFENLVKISEEGASKSVTRVALDGNHMLDGKHDELAGAIVKWLNEECRKRWEK